MGWPTTQSVAVICQSKWSVPSSNWKATKPTTLTLRKKGLEELRRRNRSTLPLLDNSRSHGEQADPFPHADGRPGGEPDSAATRAPDPHILALGEETKRHPDDRELRLKDTTKQALEGMVYR
jgi:hypothetical protein